MSDDELRERLRALINAPPRPPLEEVASFLRSYCADAESLDEVRRELAVTVAKDPRSTRRALEAIEHLLNHPPAEGKLAYLVAVEGNMPLERPGDEGAILRLRQMAELIREVLKQTGSNSDPGNQSPPPAS